LCAKGPYAEDIHKGIFPVYGGKCSSGKAVHNWVEKFSQGCSEVADDTRPGAEVAETTVQETSMLQVLTHWESDWTSVSMLVEVMSRNKCFFPGSNITCFTFYIYL
jgi:hypothetical protein